MNAHRSAAVWAAINMRARADGTPPSLKTVCLTCAHALDASGAAVALSGRRMGYEPVYASSQDAQRLLDLHATLGEGPGLTAMADRRPVLVPDLSQDEAQRRWPMFAPAALKPQIRALFAFPLQLGAISVGVLEICRAEPGWLTPDQVADALHFADAALLVHVQHPNLVEEHGMIELWAPVHQATGMVAVQAHLDLSTAFVRLRAHAFAEGRGLLEVAHDVVARRLRFPPESS
ncbi:GAF and ANTAR domain-containing protein [Nonomuraea sp. NPDC050556]|uniref:GAF and ANTAR domain-containing protein n=1 Tax=Nonomuraea sp. NPDC050556 TaxID=3364369 RepID=UPI0037973414